MRLVSTTVTLPSSAAGAAPPLAPSPVAAAAAAGRGAAVSEKRREPRLLAAGSTCAGGRQASGWQQGTGLRRWRWRRRRSSNNDQLARMLIPLPTVHSLSPQARSRAAAQRRPTARACRPAAAAPAPAAWLAYPSVALNPQRKCQPAQTSRWARPISERLCRGYKRATGSWTMRERGITMREKRQGGGRGPHALQWRWQCGGGSRRQRCTRCQAGSCRPRSQLSVAANDAAWQIWSPSPTSETVMLHRPAMFRPRQARGSAPQLLAQARAARIHSWQAVDGWLGSSH